MTSTKHFSTAILFIVVIFTFNTQTNADSVYAIPDHWGQPRLNVYDVLGNDKEGQFYSAVYNPICDFDHDYDVDIVDFASFCENWLWQACWRANYILYGMSSGGESMMMSAPAFMSPSTSLESQFVEEKSIQDQILDLEDCIELLEKIWLEDPYIQQAIDPYDWKEFMDAVYETMFLLKAESIHKQ